MEDAAEVTTAVLKRGPKKALLSHSESSIPVNLTSWLTLHAELPEAYYRLDQGSSYNVRRRLAWLH